MDIDITVLLTLASCLHHGCRDCIITDQLILCNYLHNYNIMDIDITGLLTLTSYLHHVYHM